MGATFAETEQDAQGLKHKFTWERKTAQEQANSLPEAARETKTDEASLQLRADPLSGRDPLSRYRLSRYRNRHPHCLRKHKVRRAPDIYLRPSWRRRSVARGPQSLSERTKAMLSIGT